MTTLSPTSARSNLSKWLALASQGEDIGILYGNQVIALRPVVIESVDYALQEYGATNQELKTFTNKLHREGAKESKTRKLKEFKGNIEALLES